MSNKIAPLPWRRDVDFIVDAKGGVVCDLAPSGPDGDEHDRGTLILTAVNAHGKLRAMLRTMLGSSDMEDHGPDEQRCLWCRTVYDNEVAGEAAFLCTDPGCVGQQARALLAELEGR